MARKYTQKMSISGMQQKLSVKIEGTQIVPTDVGGTYILKPTPQEYEELSENEHLSMQIGKLLGIQTAESGLITFKNGENAYIVKRFDRVQGQKIDQEDLAQILGRERDDGGNFKYSGSYEEVGNTILKACGGKKAVLLRFLERLIYNFLIGNGDYHLKNISLVALTEDGKYQDLSPNYDSVNTNIYNPVEQQFALQELFIDGTNTPQYEKFGFYTQHDFFELGRRVGVPSIAIVPFLGKTMSLKDQVFDLINTSYLNEDLKKKYLNCVKDRYRAIADY